MIVAWLVACSQSPPPPPPPAPVEAPAPAPPPAPAEAPVAAGADPCAGVPTPPKTVPFGARDAKELVQGCAWEAKGDAAGWDEALKYYRALVKQNPSPAAHYLAARAAARLRATGPGANCRYEAYASDLLDDLVAAGADPGLRTAMAAEPLFEPVHSAVRYRMAQGQKPAEIAQNASGLVLWGPAAGVFGNTLAADLHDKGAATVRTRNADHPEKWDETRRPDAWKPEGDKLKLDVGQGAAVLEIRPDGSLGDGKTLWTDHPSECEA